MISIIIPVYNSACYLEQCLSSITSQEYSDWECILIDDGSVDESGAICDKWGDMDERFRVIHQSNCGVSAARNQGIAAAKGDYIVFIDSDDFVRPTYLSHLIERADNSIGLVVSGFILYPISPSYHPFIPEMDTAFDLDASSVDAFVSLNDQWLLNGPVCKLYRSDIIKNNNLLFDPKLSFGEDFMFNYSYLPLINRIATVSKQDYFYRETGNSSLSNKYNDSLFSHFYSQWKILKSYLAGRGMWTTSSMKAMYRRLWSNVYDSIFYDKTNSYHHLKEILSIPEIKEMKNYQDEYECASWIKRVIIARKAWVFFLLFKIGL